MTVEVYGVEQLLRDLREYTCPVHGCDRSPRSGRLMCPGHWRLVPADLRGEVYETVRRIERIAKRYDTAQEGSPRQAKLADEWLADEATCRESQLRAVIVASERAGARAEPLGSASLANPNRNQEVQMQEIEITAALESTSVAVKNGAGEVVDTATLETGQKVAIQIADATVAATAESPATTAGEISLGQVYDAETGSPVETPAPEDETPAPVDGEGAGGEDAPAGGDTGEGTGEQPGGETGGGETPTTSAASEKPLYRLSGDAVPEGFVPSGLETPDGATLYHYAGDTAGQPATGNVDAVSVYADADDDEKPVQAAEPTAENADTGAGASA